MSGSANNVIADTATLGGGLRTTSAATREKLLQQLQCIVKNICASYQANFSVEFQGKGFLPTVNTAAENELVLATARQMLGRRACTSIIESFYGQQKIFQIFYIKCRVAILVVGTGVEQAMLHTNRYDFNDAIIQSAASVLAQTALNYLDSH